MSEHNRRRRKEREQYGGRVVPDRKCAAHRKNGDPCQLPPIKGGAVCHKHGGRAPQVVKAARERLALASETAVEFLAEILQDERVPIGDRHRAALAILDRAGFAPGVKLELQVGPTFADRVAEMEAVMADDERIQRVRERLGEGNVIEGEVPMPQAIPRELPPASPPPHAEVPTPPDDPRVIDEAEVAELARYHRPGSDPASEYGDGPHVRQARFER